MGIFDVFSGSAGRKAAIYQAQQLQNAQNQALGQLEGARGDINTNYAAGRETLGQLPALYAPWTGSGAAANKAQADFLGLNGVGGGSAADAALANWRNSTGYRDIVDQTTDAAARKYAATGQLGSGNTLDAIARIGGNLGNQSAQQYFGNLGGLSTQGLAATGQVGQGLTNQANLYGLQGNALGNLGTQGANLIGNIGSKIGEAGASGMMAGQNASANSLNALMSLAQLGAGFAGSKTGGPMLGAIGSMFGLK